MDADLVWSLLLNLADNAQKAIEQGGEIQFRQVMLADGCLIHVLDSGRGIPPQALEHLTEAFYRVDKAGPGHRVVSVWDCPCVGRLPLSTTAGFDLKTGQRVAPA